MQPSNSELSSQWEQAIADEGWAEAKRLQALRTAFEQYGDVELHEGYRIAIDPQTNTLTDEVVYMPAAAYRQLHLESSLPQYHPPQRQQ